VLYSAKRTPRNLNFEQLNQHMQDALTNIINTPWRLNSTLTYRQSCPPISGLSGKNGHGKNDDHRHGAHVIAQAMSPIPLSIILHWGISTTARSCMIIRRSFTAAVWNASISAMKKTRKAFTSLISRLIHRGKSRPRLEFHPTDGPPLFNHQSRTHRAGHRPHRDYPDGD